MIPYIKEACVESLSQAVAAQKKGANRIELCSQLTVGGITPARSLILQVMKEVHIPVRVMIRPRAGDFVYSREEIEQMREAIEFCKATGVEGVVFGVLKQDATLDMPVIKTLLASAFPLKAVIHKAVDACSQPLEAIKILADTPGVSTVLTSAGYETAWEAREVLKQMMVLCKERIELMPAGKITTENLLELHHFLGAGAYHGKRIVGDLH